MIDPTWIGSLTDLATLILVIYVVQDERESLGTAYAGLVAVARQHIGVDDERLQDELDVDEREIEAVETTVVRGGRDG